MAEPQTGSRPLTDEEYAALTPEQLKAFGLSEKEEGAPSDFGGAVFANTDHAKVSDDTDSGIEPIRLPKGVKFDRENAPVDKPQMDVTNPAESQLAPSIMQDSSAKMDVAPKIGDAPAVADAPDVSELPINTRPLPKIDDVKPTVAPMPKPGTPEYYQRRQQELDQKNSMPWGSEFNHPGIAGKILHGFAKAGNIAGNILAPATMELIPGTDLNRRVQESQNLSGYSQAKEDELKDAQTKAALAKPTEPGKTPEETTIHDLMTGNNGQARVNPDTGKPYNYLEAYGAVQEAKSGAKPEKEDQKLLTATGTTPDVANSQFTRRWQTLHPDQPLPADLVMNANSKVADYKRADAALKSEEGVENIATTRDATKAQRDIDNQRHADERQDKLTKDNRDHEEKLEKEARDFYEKKIAPLSSAMNFADDYLKSGAYTGSNDDALLLQFFEVAKPETGFRLTQAEMKRQSEAQSWRNSAEAYVRHALHGTWFSDEQRKQMVQSMHDIGEHKRNDLEAGAPKKTSEITAGRAPSAGNAKFHYQSKQGEIFSNDGKTWYDDKGAKVGK